MGSVDPDSGRGSLGMSPYGWSTKVASSSEAETGCSMKCNKALGVVLVTALSGSLLVGGLGRPVVSHPE